MVIICCGSRTFKDKGIIRKELESIKDMNNGISVTEGNVKNLDKLINEGITIVHGNAKGADKLVDEIAQELGYTVKRYPALWKIGKNAGRLRNIAMVQDTKPDLVLAFRTQLDSRGTNHMIYTAHMNRIPYKIIQGGCHE